MAKPRVAAKYGKTPHPRKTRKAAPMQKTLMKGGR
jgi:hypothetical protein